MSGHDSGGCAVRLERCFAPQDTALGGASADLRTRQPRVFQALIELRLGPRPSASVLSSLSPLTSTSPHFFRHLAVGDQLRTPDGQASFVTSVTNHPQLQDVWRFYPLTRCWRQRRRHRSFLRRQGPSSPATHQLRTNFVDPKQLRAHPILDVDPRRPPRSPHRQARASSADLAGCAVVRSRHRPSSQRRGRSWVEGSVPRGVHQGRRLRSALPMSVSERHEGLTSAYATSCSRPAPSTTPPSPAVASLSSLSPASASQSHSSRSTTWRPGSWSDENACGWY